MVRFWLKLRLWAGELWDYKGQLSSEVEATGALSHGHD